MKKLFTFVITAILSLSLLTAAGCVDPTPSTTPTPTVSPSQTATPSASPKTEIDFYVPDGAPALTIAGLVSAEFENYNINFHVVAGDQIAGKVANGEADVVIMPTNAGANLFNKGKDIQLVSANVHGLLYLVGKENLTSLDELKGKVVYNIGQGQTPDATFRYILQQNGIECVISDVPVDGKVALQFVSEGSALVALLKTNAASYGILGEPVATQAVSAAGVSVLFDIQEEWRNVTGLGNFPQASLFMKSELANDTAFVDELLAKLNQNDDWIVQNPAEAKAAIQSVGSNLAVNLSSAIIQRCNINTVSATDAKSEILAYLNVLYQFNPDFVGGAVPGDDFFYER